MDRHVAYVRRSAFEFVEGIERLSSTGEIMDAMGALLKKHGFEPLRQLPRDCDRDP